MKVLIAEISKVVTPNLFTQPWQKNEMKTFRGLFPSTSKLSYGVIAKSMKNSKLLQLTMAEIKVETFKSVFPMICKVPLMKEILDLKDLKY